MNYVFFYTHNQNNKFRERSLNSPWLFQNELKFSCKSYHILFGRPSEKTRCALFVFIFHIMLLHFFFCVSTNALLGSIRIIQFAPMDVETSSFHHISTFFRHSRRFEKKGSVLFLWQFHLPLCSECTRNEKLKKFYGNAKDKRAFYEQVYFFTFLV